MRLQRIAVSLAAFARKESDGKSCVLTNLTAFLWCIHCHLCTSWHDIGYTKDQLSVNKIPRLPLLISRSSVLQGSPVTVTGFLIQKRISLYSSSSGRVTLAYSDTFPLSQGCHCERGALYTHQIWFQLRSTLALSIALVLAAVASAEPIREDSYVEKNLIYDGEAQDLEPISEPALEGELAENLKNLTQATMLGCWSAPNSRFGAVLFLYLPWIESFYQINSPTLCNKGAFWFSFNPILRKNFLSYVQMRMS